MKGIKLTQGKITIVDDKDYEKFSNQNWHYRREGRIGYASQLVRVKGKWKAFGLHRQILGLPHGDKRHVDHINGNSLDNRRKNLRICTNSQNQQNRGAPKSNTSGYKGVSWHKASKCWRVQIKSNRKVYHLGYYDSSQQAALVYNMAAIQHHGQFAYLNPLPMKGQ